MKTIRNNFLKTIIISLFIYGFNITKAQTVITNFNFNGAASYPVSASSTATNITGSISSTESFISYSGTTSSV